MKSLNRTLTIFWSILVFSIVISVGFLIFMFHKQHLSNNIQDWGVFGDYIGGVIGSILAIANLFIFIQITLLLAKRDDESNEKQIKAQQIILLSQLRNEAITHISEELNSYIKKTGDMDKNQFLESVQARHVFLSFCQNNEHLFNPIDKKELDKAINNLCGLFEKMQAEKIKNKGEFLSDAEKELYQQLGGLFEDFFIHKGSFIKSLQKQLIEGLSLEKMK